MRGADLTNLAAGIASSFASRNNDHGGYWAIGLLRSLADTLAVDRLRLFLVPPVRAHVELLTDLAARYRSMLQQRILATHRDMQDVCEARIDVSFDRSASIATCEVELVDARGRRVARRERVTCWPHDPRRERRSARAE